MTNSKCDFSNPNFTYSYCPSYPAAVLFAVLFSITTAAHVYQAYRFRKHFAMILIMGGLWEVVGYAIRTISIQNPYSNGPNTAQMLLILLAPLWINAFMYMLVGRMIHFYLDDDRIFGVKARRITLIFVGCDLIAFIVQGTGGSMSASTDMNVALTGLHVYTGGVALQAAFNAVFLAITGRFHTTAVPLLKASRSNDLAMNDRADSSDPAQLRTHSYSDCLWLLRVVYGVILLVLFRNFYRLAEFASGLDNTIIRHEWYAYVFDAVPMFAAMVILNVFYPGKKLQGPNCDFTEENKALKQAKQERKAAKKAEKSGKDEFDTPIVVAREVSDDSSA